VCASRLAPLHCVSSLWRDGKRPSERTSHCVITVSTFCNGMMTRGTIHTDTIRRYARSLDPPLMLLLCRSSKRSSFNGILPEKSALSVDYSIKWRHQNQGKNYTIFFKIGINIIPSGISQWRYLSLYHQQYHYDCHPNLSGRYNTSVNKRTWKVWDLMKDFFNENLKIILQQTCKTFFCDGNVELSI
jgi:hypothetical protein